MTNNLLTTRCLKCMYVFSIIILLAFLPLVSLMAQPDDSGNWVANPNAHVIYEGLTYMMEPEIGGSSLTPRVRNEEVLYDNSIILTSGTCKPVSRWHQMCPDTIGLKHERVTSGAPEHIFMPNLVQCNESHDYTIIKTFVPRYAIDSVGVYMCTTVGSYAFADYDRYFSTDGSMDSIVFHPTKIKSFVFNDNRSRLSAVREYAFAECRELEGEIAVEGSIFRGAFQNCRRVSLSIDGSCICDSFIGDSIRKVKMEWSALKFPIFHYADTIVVPRGCRAGYESFPDMKAGVIIEGDYEPSAEEQSRLSDSAYDPPRQLSIYIFDDPNMMYWWGSIFSLVYDNLTYQYRVNFPSFPYSDEPYVVQGFKGTLQVEYSWTGRYVDTEDSVILRTVGCLDDDVVVPEYVYTDKSNRVILGDYYSTNKTEYGYYYVVTEIDKGGLRDSTAYFDKFKFYHKNLGYLYPDKVSFRSLRSLKLPKTIMRIREYGLAHNYLLTEHYDLPLLERLDHGALLGCRHVSINIPAKCFCERYVADTLRKVSVHWSAPNNYIPICQYVDTLVVPRGMKDQYAFWWGMKAGIIIEGDYAAEGLQPVTDVMTPIADRPANSGDDAIYDLQGRRLSSPPQSGVYIKNRKKFVYQAR